MPTLAQLFAEGFETGERLSRERRARSAAREEFGAAADDPALFNQLQQGRSMENNQRRQDVRLGMEQRRQDFTVRREQQVDTRANALRVINGLRSARDQGKDLSEAFDSVVPALEQMGVDPAQFDMMRQAVVDDPTVLDTYYTALSGEQPAGAGPAGAPEVDVDDQALAESEILKIDDVLARIDRLQDPAREKEGRAAFGTPGLRKLGQQGFGALGTIPGGPAAGYVADLDALEGDIRSIAFETLKGGGQITVKESEFAADAIARLSRSMPFEQYQRELDDLRGYMTQLQEVARRRLRGERVPSLEPPRRQEPAQTGGMTGNAQVQVGERVPGVGTFKGGDPTDISNYEPE